jgi:hypothetical protein
MGYITSGLCWNATTGWPAYHQSTVHSSALMYDIDKDGIREVALATFNGEVIFFRYIQLFILPFI